MKKLIAVALLIVLSVGLAVGVQAGDKKYKGVAGVYTTNATADNIVLDGVIHDGEWGKPILTVTPQSVNANYNIGWEYVSNTEELPTDQKVEIYVINEGNTLYVGCKLIGVDYDDTSADTLNNMHKYPHFGFSMATYVEKTVITRTNHKGNIFEKFGHFMVGFVEGQKATKTKTQGMDPVNLKPDDYEIQYDRATRTYMFEVRVADGYTPVDLTGNGVFVMSFDVGGPNNGTANNRYLISRASERAWGGTGAYFFPHGKTNPVLIQVRPTSELASHEFVSTSTDAQTQSGTFSYDDVVRTQEQRGMPLVATIAMSVVSLGLLGVVIILICKRKNS